MDKEIFRREDTKYSSLWIGGYKDAHWKRLAKVGVRLARSLEGTVSLVDFGFGSGSAMDFFESSGIVVEGIEISGYAANKQQQKGRKIHHTSLDDLSTLKDGQFRIGFCNDVIEHVPEGLVIASLDEMARACSDYLLISICPTPSHHLSLDGENLHLTVKPEIWWESLLRNYGELQKVKLWFSRSARYIIGLKHQK